MPATNDEPRVLETGAPSAAERATDGLPVRLDVRGPQGEAIRRWIESVVGWQPVDGSQTAMHAALALWDVAALTDAHAGAAPAGSHGVQSADAPPQDRAAQELRAQDPGRSEDVPRIVLVTRDDDALATGVACREAAAVVAWPDERDRLPTLAAALAPDPASEHDCSSLSVSGAAGGVGTTTVAFALGGLAAWKLGRSIVTTPAAPGTPGAGEAVLDGAPAWAAGNRVPGVADLRSVQLPRRALDAALNPGGARFVVRDRGTALDTDVLVVRRDRRAMSALERTSAGLVVVTDAGRAPARMLREAVAGRRTIVVPWSARVARAGLNQRLPGGLPGSWLRLLAPIVEAWR